MSTTSIEDIGALTDGPKCFQVYIHRDRGLTREFVQRTKAAGYGSLCLTVDTLVAGNRERDLPRLGERLLPVMCGLGVAYESGLFVIRGVW